MPDPNCKACLGSGYTTGDGNMPWPIAQKKDGARPAWVGLIERKGGKVECAKCVTPAFVSDPLHEPPHSMNDKPETVEGKVRRLADGGMTLQGVVTHLNATGVRQANGKRWNKRAVQRFFSERRP